jgi:hypothetical protein
MTAADKEWLMNITDRQWAHLPQDYTWLHDWEFV